MARIGVRYPKYCKYTVTQNPDGTENEILGIGGVAGKAISIKATINADAVKQYADDGVAETATEFTDGTLELELNDLIDSVESDMLGMTVEDDGSVISSGDDNAPYMRVGYVEPHLLNNVKSYRSVMYYRVKFSPPSSEAQTKGEKLTFGSSTISGTIMRNKDNFWRVRKAFTTEAAAVAWLNQQLNIGGTIPAITCTTVPADAATGVALDTAITATFNNSVDHGNATLLNASTHAVIPATKVFDGEKKVLTITPSAALTASTQYMLVLEITDAYAQEYTAAITFTTAAP